MKLNLVNLSNVIGGQEIYLYNILQWHNKYMYNFFTNVHPWKKQGKEKISRVEFFHIKNIEYAKFLDVRKQILQKTSANDVFIFNGNRAIYLGSLLPTKYKKIAIQHSSLVDSQDGRLKQYLRVLLYKFLLSRFDRLIGVSENTIAPLKSSPKVFVVRNGVNTDKYYPVGLTRKLDLRRQLGFEDTDRIILMVGALTPNKGQVIALSILETLGSNYKLILVGEGPDRENIERTIIGKGLAKRVKLVGQLSDVSEYYWLADLLLCFSNNEGLPLTILEAMATGLPIVTTNVGGIPELIVEKENGIFVDRDNVIEAAKNIRLLCEDREKLQSMREKNINKITAEYPLEKCIASLFKHIEEVSALKCTPHKESGK
ncbi:glycosyltransferase family 4 protein [Anaerospora sp.]|uniref:glycosyltransferase family 4 protein n=1 Tax=Anaerospora sp. TaxID=1960278 RepID=UPI00289FF0B9|nr:glycosyltransferase family 4 protein [Anaerospora sp.]